MEEKKGHTYRQWIVANTGNLIVMSYGLQIGWMSPMTKLLTSDRTPTDLPITDAQISYIASAISLVAAMATAPLSWMADMFGRKKTLLAVIMFQALCWIIKLSTTSMAGLFTARIMSGIAAGGVFNVVTMYVKEISQSSLRGVLVTLPILFQNVGIMVMYAMGSCLEYYTIIVISMMVPAVNLILMSICPESPAYLVKIGRNDEALTILSSLRGLQTTDKDLIYELDLLKNENSHSSNNKSISYLEIFRDRCYFKSFLVMLVLTSFVQAGNGLFVILSYASSIMSDAGVTYSPDLQTLSFPAVMIVGTMFSVVLVERAGRKLLFTGSLALTFVSISTLATSLLIQSQGGSTPGWIPVVTIIVTAFSYAAGVCPMPFLIMNECFNVQVRSKLIGIIVTMAWLTCFFQVLFFSNMVTTLGLYACFYIFAGINVFGVIFAMVFMPETKGKSLDEIERYFRGK